MIGALATFTEKLRFTNNIFVLSTFASAASRRVTICSFDISSE